MKITTYLPDRSEKKFPVVIGLPGLVHSGEQTRIDKTLEELAQKHGIAGIRVTYRDISEDINKRIRCSINLDRSAEDLKEVIDLIKSDPKYDERKIGVVVSSMSAGFFIHYLTKANEEQLPLAKFATINPLYGWKNFANEEVRKRILASDSNFEITSSYDKEKEIIRYIPREDLTNLATMDGISKLKSLSSKIQPKEVLSLIGVNDERADPLAMEEAHYLLGGKPSGIKRFNAGHDIPLIDCVPELVTFFSYFPEYQKEAA